MKLTVIVAIFAATLLAEGPKKLDESLLKARWKALAVHYSNTVKYMEMQAELAKSKAAYEKAMADLKAACDGSAVDDSGPEVVCKEAK